MSYSSYQVYRGLYKDSVTLMLVTAALTELDDVDEAAVVMATGANRANLRRVGLDDSAAAGPNDLLVVVRGTEDAVSCALLRADELLTQESGSSVATGVTQVAPTSLKGAVRQHPEATVALISVPGASAAAEALKALQLGLDVMIFSDNVPLDQEIAIKKFAESRGRFVMGPDCGTAIIGGVPLGFANSVRRGPIGVIGASGTGVQEVTTRIHHWGSGVSHALGTGGHDVSDEVGAISMLRGMRMLDEDPDTSVVVIVSKPPAPTVAATVLDAARALTTPVVVAFVGPGLSSVATSGVRMASTLADAADQAVAMVAGDAPVASPADPSVPAELLARAGARSPSRRFLRGVFSGGTFCYETQALCQQSGIQAFSNVPITGNLSLPDVWQSGEHTIVDMGDDEFTRGRPHPMIDPGLRDERLAAELADPGTAVVVFDVVLGYGAAVDPIGSVLTVLESACRADTAAGEGAVVIAHVCGTESDPQDRAQVIDRLRASGVFVAGSNAEAARWAAAAVSAPCLPSAERNGR